MFSIDENQKSSNREIALKQQILFRAYFYAIDIHFFPIHFRLYLFFFFNSAKTKAHIWKFFFHSSPEKIDLSGFLWIL